MNDKDVQTTNIQNTFILCLLRFLWYVMFIQDMRNNMKRTPIELVDTAFEVYVCIHQLEACRQKTLIEEIHGYKCPETDNTFLNTLSTWTK